MQFHSQSYHYDQCITFLKTTDQFGGLSNMAGGYPLFINNISILTSEALYQACRFPHKSEVQKIIIAQRSPMTAKMKSKPYRKDSRPDWDSVRIHIMWWCLRVKLAQHWEKFGNLLLATGDKPIVEVSYRDPFWGAKPVTSETLDGINILGQLLTHLREQLKGPKAENLKTVSPLTLPQFLLLNTPIGVIEASCHKAESDSVLLPGQVAREICVSPEKQDITNNDRDIKQINASMFVIERLDSRLTERTMPIQLAFEY